MVGWVHGFLDDLLEPEKHYSDWVPFYCLRPRKINGEWHWFRKAYYRWCFLDNVKEYGTILDVMTLSKTELLIGSVNRWRKKEYNLGPVGDE